MRKRIIALCLALLAGLAVLLPVPPANAQETSVSPLPSTLSSYKFWPMYTGVPNLTCVAVGDTVIPIGVAAQAWNNATGGATQLDASPNCIAEGYPPSRRMTIDTYSAADGRCYKLTNTYYTTADTWRWWTGNPLNVVGWVNRYYEGCWSTANLRAKWTSLVIGRILGANELSGSTWASRVMSTTSAVIYPSASTDGYDVGNLYLGVYYGRY
jgi:hypothetical protein